MIALALAACGTAAHCGFSNFTVLFEGAEPVEAAPSAAAPADSSRTAYRVRYQCDAGIPVGTPPAGPPRPGS